MKMHALILSPGDDILLEVEKYCQNKNISIGVILSAVGDISEVRLLNSNSIYSSRIKEPMEIIGITGTVSSSRTHLHIILSRKSFNVIGGHLPHGCYVGKSVEIIIGEFTRDETIHYIGNKNNFYNNPVNEDINNSEFENDDMQNIEENYSQKIRSDNSNAEKKSDTSEQNQEEYASLITNLFKNNKL